MEIKGDTMEIKGDTMEIKGDTMEILLCLSYQQFSTVLLELSTILFIRGDTMEI